MPNTYTLIEKITVGAAGASSITFTSIPQTYTDLKVVVSARGNGVWSNEIRVTFNGSTTSYSNKTLYGTGSTAGSHSAGTTFVYGAEAPAANITASVFSNTEIYIPNYTSSNYKSASVDSVRENNSTTNNSLELVASLWSNTAAITSVTIGTDGAYVWQQYSTFYLYGVAKEGVTPSPSSAPYATGGDSIVFDGTYWIHTFTSSGTFTPKKGLTCDYLVAAGGGGAGGGGNGGWTGGGGGAGGYKTSTNFSCSSGVGLTVTVGAGGTGGTYGGGSQGTIGTNGSNSVFSSITSTGGGYGGFGSNSTISNGGNGGSGGGAGSSGGSGGTGGTGTSGQGNNGGNSAGGNVSGGGGGANSAGGSGTAGTGLSSSYSGASVTYSAGGATTGGTAGTTNTGNGGNSSGTAAGGNGGSGIVIVRYAA